MSGNIVPFKQQNHHHHLQFDFNGSQVTTIVDGDGNPWWVAKEVCEVLGYARANDAVTAHCKCPKLLKHGELPVFKNPCAWNVYHPRIRPIPPDYQVQLAGGRALRKVDHGRSPTLHPQNGIIRYRPDGSTKRS